MLTRDEQPSAFAAQPIQPVANVVPTASIEDAQVVAGSERRLPSMRPEEIAKVESDGPEPHRPARSIRRRSMTYSPETEELVSAHRYRSIPSNSITSNYYEFIAIDPNSALTSYSSTVKELQEIPGSDTCQSLAVAYVHALRPVIEDFYIVSATTRKFAIIPTDTNILSSHSLSDTRHACCTTSTAMNTFAWAAGQPHTFCTSLLYLEDTRQVLPLGGMD